MSRIFSAPHAELPWPLMWKNPGDSLKSTARSLGLWEFSWKTLLAFEISVDGGVVGVLEPRVLINERSGGKVCFSEVKLYGDLVLRYMSNFG